MNFGANTFKTQSQAAACLILRTSFYGRLIICCSLEISLPEGNKFL